MDLLEKIQMFKKIKDNPARMAKEAAFAIESGILYANIVLEAIDESPDALVSVRNFNPSPVNTIQHYYKDSKERIKRNLKHIEDIHEILNAINIENAAVKAEIKRVKDKERRLAKKLAKVAQEAKE